MTAKRTEPSFKGSVSLTGAALTREPAAGCESACAYTRDDGANESSANAVNNEARMRLMVFPFMTDRRARYGSASGMKSMMSPFSLSTKSMLRPT